jgi:hypothetical protein
LTQFSLISRAPWAFLLSGTHLQKANHGFINGFQIKHARGTEGNSSSRQIESKRGKDILNTVCSPPHQVFMNQRKHIPDSVRDAILREAGYRCAVPTCNIILAIDLHHIVEVGEGGGNEPSNLLALCPTCHALYHRGTISGESIRKWKARLVAMNNIIDTKTAAIERARSSAEEAEAKNGMGQRKGFALAAAEFMWRTYEVGFVYEEKRFVGTGYCCFVAANIAISISEVTDWAGEIGAARKGRPVIWTARGFAPFTVKSGSERVRIVVLEVGEIDDAYVKRLLTRYTEPLTAKAMAAAFAEPLQTPVRYRIVPFVGEPVAFLNAPKNSLSHRSTKEFQVESATVSFSSKLETQADFAQYVLTPVLSKIDHRGSPVFTESGTLVGLIRDTILLEAESAWRPVVTSLVPVLEVFRPDREEK